MVLKGELLEKPTYSVIHTMAESGSTGVCYRAWHEVYKRDVVQKTVSLLGLDDAASYSEPELLNRLRHDHLAEVWEAQWDPDPAMNHVKAVTFVMPYYEGGSVLRALTDGHRFSIGEAIGIACGVLDALHYLHVDERLLHRDVKPANVLLDADRRYPYLADLGSAAPMSAQNDAEARSGTPLYHPPESRNGRYTVQGELYSCGMVLLECLNGPLPYANLDYDAIARRLAAGHRAVPARLLAPGPQVPPQVRHLVKRMIDIDPRRRPKSALLAQRTLQNAVHMDWRERTEGGARLWEGRWPPADRPGQGRRYEVRAESITGGRYAGQLSFTARWRRESGTDWRAFASLAKRAAPGDVGALADFFRAVEERAQKSAAA